MTPEGPPRVQRRLAAILSADVAYSRLIEADEEGTLSGLKGVRAEMIEPIKSMSAARFLWAR